MKTILGVNAEGLILLRLTGDVEKLNVPMELNGVAVVAQELTDDLIVALDSVETPNGGVIFDGESFTTLPLPTPTIKQQIVAVEQAAPLTQRAQREGFIGVADGLIALATAIGAAVPNQAAAMTAGVNAIKNSDFYQKAKAQDATIVALRAQL